MSLADGAAADATDTTAPWARPRHPRKVDAYALADRVAIVESGRVVQAGTLAEVTAHPRSRYVADLVGVNLLSGIFHDGVLTTATGATVVVADAEPGPSYAVIRPHSITLARTAPSSMSARNSWPGTVVDNRPPRRPGPHRHPRPAAPHR